MEKTEYTIESAAAAIETIRQEIAKAFIGQQALVERLMISLLAGGHILVEGVPGLGKTLLVRSIARAIGGDSKRVQFTPDLMPSDITGNIMLNSATGDFVTKKGPVFTNLFIADEINRAPAKTQAALFEAMQEFQVSLDGTSHRLPNPFMVLATQNPYEHEGTYPLPDAQKDRFLMKVLAEYPSEDEEKEMVARVLSQGTGAELSVGDVSAVISTEAFRDIQNLAAGIRVDPSLIDYAVRLVNATRSVPSLQAGAGPRGSLALIRCARGVALIQGRDFVIPDDIKAVASPVLAHRLTLSAESELEGLTEVQIVETLVAKTEAPRT
ncbi:AAA family ATPase [Breznakiella homolactica]|uniref:MoxR family ATPase n=1 Tax=Breznakiella homolactica TaxID=2798577 RepID=A0A7T7XQA6_9SPIR|nr:MoxR family ATPase [Breznakiella homolactica]QQO10479.1 MoxR family ATPase [Breznakiella homolactica]